MKKIFLMGVAMMVVSGPALAQNQAALCKLLGTHKSMSANYQPGFDVRGRPVVPADGGVAPVMAVPDVIRIPVTIELAQQLGAQIPAGVDLEAVAGVVNIDGAGKVTYNGQDLSQGAYALCGGDPASVAAPVTEKAMEAGSLGTLPASAVPAHVPVMAPAVPIAPEAVQAGGVIVPVVPAQNPPAAHEQIKESDIIWGVGE